MASNRHLGRIIALQTLYEAEFRLEAVDSSFDLDEVLARNISRYEDMVDDVDFIKQLVAGVQQNAKALDAKLQPVAPEWPIDQIARMDRLVLRIGLYELENEADVPPKVVINEAVELAKAFGGDNSSKFVNGVLGTLLRQRDPVTDPPVEPPINSDSSNNSAAVSKPAKTLKPATKPTKKVTTKANKETA